MPLRQLGGFIARVTGLGRVRLRQEQLLRAELLPAFAFAMAGVGLAAPAALSTNATVAGIALIVSDILPRHRRPDHPGGPDPRAALDHVENGVAAEQAPTLMMVVPITTILAILLLRQAHGLGVSFDFPHRGRTDDDDADAAPCRSRFLFAAFGLTVLAATGYVRRFLTGEAISPRQLRAGPAQPQSPLSVLTHFWINAGLVNAGA